MVSNKGQIFGNVWKTSRIGCHDWGSDTGIWCAGVRDAAKRPVTHRTASTTENQLAQGVSSIQAGTLCRYRDTVTFGAGPCMVCRQLGLHSAHLLTPTHLQKAL